MPPVNFPSVSQIFNYDIMFFGDEFVMYNEWQKIIYRNGSIFMA